MSRAALEAVRDADVLAQSLPYEYLEALHVPFDALTGRETVEAELSRGSERRGPLALIGASGAGKSSALAYTLGQLSPLVPEWLVPLRIPMDVAEPQVVMTAGGFARHVVRHVVGRAATERFTLEEQRRLAAGVADIERRAGRRQRVQFVAGSSIPAAQANLTVELVSAGPDIEARVMAGQTVQALAQMVELFRARGLEPFFVFDDTDLWLRTVGDETESQRLIRGFFGTNARLLALEVDCGFAVAVHEEYLEEPGYTDNAELFQEIELPRFPDPAEALRRVLARRLEVYELEVAVKDLFRPEAIEYLAVVYDGVPDVRAVVNVAAEALRAVLADPEGPELVGRPAVRTAYARRQSRGGRSPRQR